MQIFELKHLEANYSPGQITVGGSEPLLFWSRRRPDQRGLTTPVLTSGLEFCDNLPNMLKYFPFICQANNQAMTGSNTMESRGDAGPGWARRGYICSILGWLAGWLAGLGQAGVECSLHELTCTGAGEGGGNSGTKQ